MEAKLAVLIDFENIAAGTEKEGLGRFDVDALMKRVKDKGRILVARSYADWGRFARFKQSLLMANVTMYELTSHGMHDKNRADIAMVVDALELAFTREHIDTFVIVSGDSDFTPLVLKMRELGKSVIGCGTRSSTSRLLIEACDEFFFYDSIAQDARKRRIRPANQKGYDLSEAFDLLLDAVEGLQRENPDPPLASVVKSALQRKSPDFAESDLKFSSFGRFLEAAQEKGKVRLSRDEKSGGYRVDASQPSKGAAPGNSNRPAPKEESDGNWIDPYAPPGTEPLIVVLAEENFNPLSAPTRKAIIDHLEECVSERKKRRRRTSVNFIQEDVRKRLEKTHPDVPPKAQRQVFNALMRAGVFLHRDGTPVRTGLAPFDLQKDAEAINKALTNVYLDVLFEEGVDLSGSALLADLFLGDTERSREIEEVVAWLQASHVDEGGGDDDALDDLLEVEPTEESGGEEIGEAVLLDEDDDAKAEEAKPKKKSRGRRKKKPTESTDDADDAKDEAKPAAEASLDDALELVEDDAPKKKTTRKRKKKSEDDEAASDLDALLSSDD